MCWCAMPAWQLACCVGRAHLRAPEMFFVLYARSVSIMSHHTSLPRGPMPPRIRIALDAIRHGRAVVLLDDDDRENEGDLIVATDRLTVPMMATMIRECSGIVCLCLPDEQLQRLALPPMV